MIYKTERTCDTSGTYKHQPAGLWFHCDICKVYLPIYFIKISAYTSKTCFEHRVPISIDGVCSPECEHLYILGRI